MSDELSSLLATGPALWEEEKEELSKVTAALLEHPAMASWVLPVEKTGVDTGEMRRRFSGREEESSGPHSLASMPLEALGKLAASVVTEDVPQELAGQLIQALLAQSAWLHYAGDQSYARHAVYVAESLRREPLHSHPLLLQMIALGFLRPPGAGSAPD